MTLYGPNSTCRVEERVASQNLVVYTTRSYTSPVCWLLRAALTKYHKLGGFNHRNVVPLTVLGAGHPRSRYGRGCLTLRAVRETLSHASPLAPDGLLVTSCIPWFVDASYHLHLLLRMTFSLCVCLSVSKCPFIFF